MSRHDLVVRRAHQLTQGPFSEPISWQQTPRNERHAQIFWLKMVVGFNGVQSELVTSATEPEGFDCLVSGAWTDEINARVRITETESDRAWSTPQIPVRSIMGNSTEVQPLLHIAPPILLEARNTLKGDWINAAAEPAGTACFHSRKVGLDPNGNPYDGAIRITRSQAFWLLLDLSATTSSTDPVNSDVLIWGASTNCGDAIQGRITNESSNYSWSSLNIPIRAMAGVDGQVQPIMRYHNPYLLPNNVKLRADINTAVAGNYISLLCERILQ